MRKPRHKSQKPIAHYHVISRAVQQFFLFTDPVKEEIVEPWVRLYTQVYYVTLHSEVEMTNHGHALITVRKPEFDFEDVKRRFLLLNSHLSRPVKWDPDKAEAFYERISDLSCFMRDLKWRISWEYNRAHDTKGHLWDGRFKSLEVRGERQMGLVDTYIQQNPVRAQIVEKPSEYPYCTAGRIKKAMETGKPVEAPAIGLFAKIKDRLSRCKAYVAYQDWIAHLIRNPSARNQLAPPAVIALGITDEDWEKTRQEINSRAPVDWWSGIYEEKPVKTSPQIPP